MMKRAVINNKCLSGKCENKKCFHACSDPQGVQLPTYGFNCGGQVREQIPVRILYCNGCGDCVPVCPVNAITMEDI